MMMPMQARSWTPLRAFEVLQSELERAARASLRPIAPAVNLYRREDRILVLALVPGMTPEALHLAVDGDTLTLSGQWPSEPIEGVRSQHLERPEGAFERRLQMPFEIEASSVQASLENGVLRVELTRTPEAAPLKIEIRSQASQPRKGD